MERLKTIGRHLLPQSSGSPSMMVQEIAPSLPPVAHQSPCEESVADHIAGRSSLWSGPRSHVDKAMDIFFDQGVVNFPLVDVQKEADIGVEKIRNLIFTCEKAMPEAAPAVWGTSQFLITGATGFIGMHFLVKMLAAFPKAHMWCLVRGKNSEHCMERLQMTARQFSLNEEIGDGWRRVVGVPGDIRKSKLGMMHEDYETLVGRVETVLHLAAKDNFFLPFELLHTFHIGGMMNVTEFCVSRRVKSMLYISTCKARIIEELNGKIVPNEGLYNGYAQTKYVAHCMAEELVRLRGKSHCAPPMALLNMGYVHYQCSPPAVPDITDAWEVVLKVCLETGVVPIMDVPMDWAPIDYVTNCLVEIVEDYSKAPMSQGSCEPRWSEVYAPDPIRFSDVVDAMQELRKDRPLRLIPVPEFVKVWKEVLWPCGKAAKFLSLLCTNHFERQISTVFTVGPNLYHSRKHGAPPKQSREYLMDLVRIIDEQMALDASG